MSNLKVTGSTQATNLTAPSSLLDVTSAKAGEVSSTGELLRQVPGINARRTSALNLDPQVRGYNSSQLNATANGMNQLKTRVDIDSLFSQIDPGIIDNISVIDGPYTSLYGPGFAFLAADLISPPRFSRPETHLSTNFVYGSNAQTLYSRDNVVSGAENWGVLVSYGLRAGNDYLTGGGNDAFLVPSSYQEWNGFFSVGYDLNSATHIEFDYIRNDMNNVELPGVVYDINNSKNDQFNLRYIIQEDPNGPQQLVLQTWWNQTHYTGDASRASKQDSFYSSFITPNFEATAVNTVAWGHLLSLGVRGLRTFGSADRPQLTVGADWRRYEQMYHEYDLDPEGNITWDGGIWGIARSREDDIGVLADYSLPLNEKFTVNLGGRVDYCKTWIDPTDVGVAQYDPPESYYTSGLVEPSKTLGMAYLTGKIKLSEEYSIKAGTGFAMRMPNLAELYTDEPYVPVARFGNSYTIGLSTLEPEKNLQFDLGLNYKSKKVSYGVRGYFAMIRDYILPVPAMTTPPPADIISPKVLGRNFSGFPPDERYDQMPPFDVNENGDYCQLMYQYVNIDLATLLGSDLYAEVKLTNRLTVYGNMSYILGTNETPVNFIINEDNLYALEGHKNPLGGTDGLPGIYPLNGVIGVRVLQGEEDRWCLDFNARMVRAQDHPAIILAEVPAPGYTVFNLRGYYRVRKNVKVNMEIQNLFNRYYTDPGSLAIINPNTGLPAFLPEPGITALLGVDARF